MGQSRRLHHPFRFARTHTTNLYRFWSRKRFGRVPWLLHTLTALLRSETAGLERFLGTLLNSRVLAVPLFRYSEVRVLAQFRSFLFGLLATFLPLLRTLIMFPFSLSRGFVFPLSLLYVYRRVLSSARFWRRRDFERYSALVQRLVSSYRFTDISPHRAPLPSRNYTPRIRYHTAYPNFTSTVLRRVWARLQIHRRVLDHSPTWLRLLRKFRLARLSVLTSHRSQLWLQVLRQGRVPYFHPRAFLPALYSTFSPIYLHKFDLLSWTHLQLLTRKRKFITIPGWGGCRVGRFIRNAAVPTGSTALPTLHRHCLITTRLGSRLRYVHAARTRRRARQLSSFLARLLRYFALSPNLHYRLVYRHPFLLYLLPALLAPPLKRLLHTYLRPVPTSFSTDRVMPVPYRLDHVARTALTLKRRASRLFRFFLTRLRQRYGFRHITPPFRLDVKLPRYRAKKPKDRTEQYKLLQTVRRAYGGLTPRQFWRFRRFAYSAQRRFTAFGSLVLYESRLDLFLCRTPWCRNLAEARAFIRRGWICVNGHQVFTFRYAVNLRDIVSGWQPRLSLLRQWFLTRWHHTLLNPPEIAGRIFPAYLEVDFRNLSFTYLPSKFTLARVPTPLRWPRLILPHWGRFVL